MARTLSVRQATIISVTLIVIWSVIYFFGKEGSVFDLSDRTQARIEEVSQAFSTIASLLVGAVWGRYMLSPKGERDR